MTLSSFAVARRATCRSTAHLVMLALLATLAACSSAPAKHAGAAPSGTAALHNDAGNTGALGPAGTVPGLPGLAANPRPLKIGIALGGGAARGFAHIGVLKALQAHGIEPTIVTGTSAGSVVAALYASGMSGIAMNKLALTLDETALSDWALPFRSRGLLKGVALENFVNTTLANRPIEKMPRALGIVATDLNTGQPILFQRGNTGLAVRASCSVPSIFEPVRIAGHDYVDGGLVSPVPASFARRMGAEFVIAVDISARPDTQATSSSVDVLLQTFTIMGQTIKAYEQDKYADIVIRPYLPAMGGSDFEQRNQAILAGEEAVEKIMPELQAKLAAAARRGS